MCWSPSYNDLKRSCGLLKWSSDQQRVQFIFTWTTDRIVFPQLDACYFVLFFLSTIIVIIIPLSLCYKLFLIISLSLLLVCWWLFHCYFFSYLFLHFYCYRRYNQSSCSSITELFVTLIHVNDLSSSRSAVLVSFLKSNLSYLTFRL